MTEWEALRQECLRCHACTLAETRTNVVFGVGREDAEIMIIGEAPGANEDKQGEPFVGRGGKLLVSAAAKINRRYTDNGTFAPRDVESDNTETGYDTLPATSITPASVAGATMSERAARIAPPIAITAYEAGAFHSVAIAVSVYN